MQEIQTSSHHNSIRNFWRMFELFMETEWLFVPSWWCELIGESSRYRSQNYKEWGKDDCSVCQLWLSERRPYLVFRFGEGVNPVVSPSRKIQSVESQNFQRVTLTLPDIFSLQIPSTVDNWWCCLLQSTNKYAGRWHNILFVYTPVQTLLALVTLISI